MELNLKGKITSIFGLNGSGKTYFTINKILANYKCLVHDPLHQYPSDRADVFHPKINYPEIAQENELFLEKYVKSQSKKYDLLIYEEASRTFPSGNRPLYPAMRSFLDTYRHYNNLGLVFICRRPAQIFTDIPELSHYIISFGNKGLNDIQRLNAESGGLGEIVKTLDNYEYVIVNQDRTYLKMPKI